MKTVVIGLCLAFGLLAVNGQNPLGSARRSVEEKKAAKFVKAAEDKLEIIWNKSSKVEWAFATDINDENEEAKLAYKKIVDKVTLDLGNQAKAFDQSKISDKQLKRKLNMLKSSIGTSILPKNKLDRFNNILSQMSKVYSTGKVPDYRDPSVEHTLGEISTIIADSRDPKELEHYWTQWRAASGAKMRDIYLEYIDLTNEAARLNGFRDGTEMKTESYESDTFTDEMAATWQGLKPLYEQLHAFVRDKLNKKYGSKVVPKDGPIPAHLLGNMWAQNWNNLATELRPFPQKPSLDVSQAMVDAGWTPKIMFQKADEFFQSMGLEAMRDEFWANSVIERPSDGRDMVCHASAWDFYDQKDFRIKMCTKVKQEDFIVVNHEMGHTQYQMAYRNLSVIFRSGANPGFHEGVADISSLAVGAPSYFQRLGLLGDNVDVTDEETNINLLFNMAMTRVAFMPFGYMVDKYRWDMFSGWADSSDLNCHWIKQRLEIQGVSPPNVRSEEHFDAGAKFHVAGNIGYVRYFTAFIYEFQFYRSLCLASGKYDPNDPKKPLHLCNFYGSKDAGDLMRSMMRVGASKPWKEVIKIMTGEGKMDTAAFREYFLPLEKWLREENKRNGVHVGWKVDTDQFCQNSRTSGATSFSNSVLALVFSSIVVFVIRY